jgi:signal transduction histidine kinase
VDTHLSLRNLQQKLESANKELAQQVLELNARNEELDAFAHTVAHDLKNPLTSLILHIDLVKDTWDTLPPEKIEQQLTRMDGNVEKMNTIIDELLLLACVRKGEVKPAQVDTGPLIEEVKMRQESLITKYQAEISAPGPEEWPPVLGHPQWVEEVWANYISNAIRYGGRPPVIQLNFSDLLTQVKFTVTDNGNGIDEQQQALLFTPFERLDQVHARGTGLGLSVVHRIVEKLGGEVGVQSKVGGGSTFWFTLPKK